MRDVNPKNLPRLESNDMNNKSALEKYVYSQNHHMDWNTSKILIAETDYTKRRFLKTFLLIQIIMLLMTKPIVFYPTAYHNFKIIEIR